MFKDYQILSAVNASGKRREVGYIVQITDVEAKAFGVSGQKLEDGRVLDEKTAYLKEATAGQVKEAKEKKIYFPLSTHQIKASTAQAKTKVD